MLDAPRVEANRLGHTSKIGVFQIGVGVEQPFDLHLQFDEADRAAEDRIAELEAEVSIYQDKADRAEQWLHRVYTEIEDRFLSLVDGGRGAPQRARGVAS
jgi:hypothetical protein